MGVLVANADFTQATLFRNFDMQIIKFDVYIHPLATTLISFVSVRYHDYATKERLGKLFKNSLIHKTYIPYFLL